jgi:hypothetical protein
MSKEKNISENSAESNPDLINQETAKNENFLVNNEELSSIEEPKTFQNKMEVHHHPDLHHKPKPWKEYFLEFLMIFLAVTLGFFAENIRENIKDNRQTQEYMQSIVSDLQSDLAMYQSGKDFNALHWRMIDTLIPSIKENRITASLYFIARQLTMGSTVISPNTKTYEQMKNGGILRLINKHFIADSIASYYQWVKKFDYFSDLQKTRIASVVDINYKIFDASSFFSALKEIQNNSKTVPAANNYKLLTNDPAAINPVIMQYQYYYGILILMEQRITLASEEAKRLIELIKKEYHLK